MAKPPRGKTLAAMPAYNEDKYIGSLVLKARQYVDEVLVIDDGSTDRTAEVARLAGATVIRNEENRGKGVAIQAILTEARQADVETLLILDADAQHDPDEIPYLLEPIREGFDLVIGARKKMVSKTPGYRKVGRKIILYSTNLLSRTKLTDSESGFRALSRKAIAELNLKEKGFAIETEMIAEAREKQLKVTQVPISNIYTKDGSTQHPIRHGFGVFFKIIAMISDKRPLFFFGLGGGLLTLLGLVAGARVLITFSENGIIPIGTSLISVLLLIMGFFSLCTGVILYAINRERS